MKFNESSIQQAVVNRFEQRLENNLNFRLVSEDTWNIGTRQARVDIVIYENDYPVVVIEVKKQLSSFGDGEAQLLRLLSITNARMGIVTDNQTFKFYDRNEKDLGFQEINFDEIISKITNRIPVTFEDDIKRDILTIVKDAAANRIEDDMEFQNFLSNVTEDNIVFNETSGFQFSPEWVEHDLLKNLFGDFKETILCRYTSLNALFSMLKNTSIRMNGLMGMNDTSEVDYVDNYLKNYAKTLSNRSQGEIEEINRRFILSCSNEKNIDKLTWYRLYGDDGRGVCLVFSIEPSLNNRETMLHQVNYAKESGIHPVLDFLKDIMEEVEKLTNFKFKFKNLDIWRHFFKPHEYLVEDEIRLLYIKPNIIPNIPNNWIMTNSHSIINPYIDFTLTGVDLPIRLKEIYLGPKCPEQEANLVQLKAMIRESGYNIEVKPSSIQRYR